MVLEVNLEVTQALTQQVDLCAYSSKNPIDGESPNPFKEAVHAAIPDTKIPSNNNNIEFPKNSIYGYHIIYHNQNHQPIP